MIIIEIIALCFLFLILGTFLYAGFSAAPWLPTDQKDTERFLHLAQIKKGEKIYDLGSGSGTILFAAAKKQAQAIGFEISLLPYFISLIQRPFFQEKKNISIFYKNFWYQSLSDADIIYTFLTPPIMPKLKEKIDRECRPGTKIICRVWPMPGWECIRKDESDKSARLYLYIKK